jgi:hypothetical protein
LIEIANDFIDIADHQDTLLFKTNHWANRAN